MVQKLYCYIDETGQDTFGKLFIVSVIVTSEEREQLEKILEQIERTSGKGKVKWASVKDSTRVAYIKAILSNPSFSGKLCYAVYRNTKDYLPNTVVTTARAVSLYVQETDYKATVLVDGLQQVNRFATLLRGLNVRTRKIRGVKDETEPLIRLADALSGFVRGAIEGRKDFVALLEKAKKQDFIREL